MPTCLRLIGRPAVSHGGVADTLVADRATRLLVLLALRRAWVGRREAAALLWPAHDAALAATNEQVLAQQRELGEWVGVATRLNNLAALHQARGEWAAARTRLREGLEVAERQGIAYVRPHLLVNLALVCFYAGDLDEADRVGRQTLDEAQAAANGQVAGTALLHLVRVAVRRCELARARTRLGEAIAAVTAMHQVGLQLDAVYGYAQILEAEGGPRDAAGLIRWYIARDDVEPGDRAVAQAALDKLPADAADAAPPAATLDALLEDIARQLSSPAAAAAA